MPKLLSVQHEEASVSAAADLLNCAENFLKPTITGYESLIYGYDPETKAQFS